jgi:folate-binding protein YgfZ
MTVGPAAESGAANPPAARTASPLLRRPGAVAAAPPDAGVAAHYGDPTREQRALTAGTGVVDLSHLGVVTVSGPDRTTLLNSLASQALLDLAPGESRELLLLDPHGRVEHAAAVLDDGERTWLVTETEHGPLLAAFLDRMRFMLRVEVTDVTQETAVLATTVAGGDRVASAAPGALVWFDPWPVTGSGGTRYGPPDAEHPGLETRFALALVARADLPHVVARLEEAGGVLAGALAWEALRVAAWRPRLAREVDERTIPHELDWLRTAVHLQKGCYRGQETVARVVNLGRPPRRLVLLHLDGSEHVLPDVGAPVLHEGREVGRVTTAVRHHEDGPLALAVVKRSVPVDAPLVAGGIAAAQEEVVRAEGTSDARPPERAELPPVSALRRRPSA